jgi:hypothetical protein
MTYIDTGITGAKRQSWRHDNPRDTLRNIIEGNPTAGKEKLLELFTDIVLKTKNQALLETIIEYWFANNLTSLLHSDSDLKKQFSNPDVAKIKDKIRQRIKIAAGVVLLDMVMPNKKRLADCTGAECAAVGGWLAMIAARMAPSQIVGKVFAEEDIRAMLEYEAKR